MAAHDHEGLGSAGEGYDLEHLCAVAALLEDFPGRPVLAYLSEVDRDVGSDDVGPDMALEQFGHEPVRRTATRSYELQDGRAVVLFQDRSLYSPKLPLNSIQQHSTAHLSWD